MRHTKQVTATEGRDKGRLYELTEMSARQGQLWASKALDMLASSGIDIPDTIRGLGMMGLAALGPAQIMALFGYASSESLKDDLYMTWAYLPDPKNRATLRGFNTSFPLLEDDIEEEATLRLLQYETVILHLSFFPPAVLSDYRAAGLEAAARMKTILMSTPSLEELSPADSLN